ncbi:MAG: FG-GAP repeat domain-containing protein [Phycisphaerales bacterium JB061]
MNTNSMSLDRASRICTPARAAATAAMLMLAAGASAQCAATDVYDAPYSATTGDLPMGAATGDLNNDGFIDVVTANNFGHSASILYGNGDGTLQTAIDIDAVEPGSIETVGVLQAGIADFNGDGWNDIALGVQSPDLGNVGIGILLNDGAGGFSGPPTYYAYSTQLRGLEIADMTGDGELDIIYANRDDDTINIVPGNGDGTFDSEIFIDFTGGPVGVALADYNNDGHLDVAAPMVFSNEILIATGDSNGNLTEFARFSADGPEGIAVGDLNGDGFEDLATPFLNGDAVQYFLGNGDGTFGAKQSISTGPSSLPIAIAIGDANHDGFDDIHAGLFIANAVQVLLSNGDGTFQAGQDFPVGSRPRHFTFGDLNGDGNDDLVAANGATSGTVTILLNTCSGAEPCLADANEDGMLSPADFSAWVAQFNSAGPLCDQNNDGMCSPADFSAWVANYNAGCN